MFKALKLATDRLLIFRINKIRPKLSCGTAPSSRTLIGRSGNRFYNTEVTESEVDSEREPQNNWSLIQAGSHTH